MPRDLERQMSGSRYLSRRQWLGMLGLGSAASFAGCTFGGGADDSDDTEPTDDDDDDGIDHDAFDDDDDDDDDNGEDPMEFPEVSGSYDTVQASGFDTLNPLYNTEAGAGTAIGRTLDQGYTFDHNNELVPMLYDLWTDDGGSVWVIEIRDGLEFSDPYGSFDADAFLYQIEELHQAAWAGTIGAQDWADVNVEKTGDLELQAELPSAELLWPETFDPLEYPIPVGLVEPFVEEEDQEGLRQNEELIDLTFTGNLGPYTLDEWVRDDGTSYTRNDNYYVQDHDDFPALYQEAPYFEGATISIMPEESSRLNAIDVGEVDAVGIPPDRHQEFVNKEHVRVRQVPTPYNNVISVNMRDNGWTTGPGNLFRYKEFRQALVCAIGKEEYLEGIYRGLAEPHYTWQPEWSRWFPGTDDLELWGVGDLYGGDVARPKAEEAFARSEFDYHFDGDRMVTPDGDQVVLEIARNAASPTQEQVAEYVQDELDEHLGIDIEINSLQGSAFSQNYWSAEPEGGTDVIDGEEVEFPPGIPTNPGPRSVTSANSWDLSTIFGLNTFPRNPMTNAVFFDGPDTLYNPVGYYPEFDSEAIWDDARAAEDLDELQDALDELFVEINRDMPYLMLSFGDDSVGYNPDLRGPIENFSNGWDFPAWHFE